MSADRVPLIASAIAEAVDPNEFVADALKLVKVWLAGDPGDVHERAALREQAATLRVHVIAMDLCRETELSAAEIMRRAERGLGAAVRAGQARGELMGVRGGGGPRRDYNRLGKVVAVRTPPRGRPASPRPFFSNNGEMTQIYLMTDGVTDADFDTTLAKARADGNLSRSNVCRLIAEPDVPSRTPKRRRPLPDTFRVAAGDLIRAAERISRMTVDPRFPSNAEQVARTCRYDLLRSAELLASAIGRFPSPAPEGTE